MSDSQECTCHDADWIYGVDDGEGYGEYRRGWWCATCHGEDMPSMFYQGGKPGPEWHVDINCPIHGNKSAGGTEGMTYQDLRDKLTQTCVEQATRIRELEAEVERLVELDGYNMDIYAKRTAERDSLRRRIATVEKRLAALEAKMDPKSEPKPTTGGLVEAVEEAVLTHQGIARLGPDLVARAAIKVVADWLQSRDLHGTASVLRGELDKGNRGPTFHP